MNGFLNFLKPPEHLQELEDPALIKKKYRYWRFRIFYAMFIGYVFYYFTRKSFVFVMPALAAEFGYDKAELGLLLTMLSVTYGLSKFASGIMSDQSNPRYFMAVGLIITGITNILFGFTSSLALFTIFWGINGWFQGWGWPPCARLLTHWYSKSERGSWWSVWSTSHNVGAFLIAIIAGTCAQYLGWRYAMMIPGGVCILMGLLLMNRLRDTPQSLGLPPIEKFRNDYSYSEKANEQEEKELTTRQLLFDYVLTNKWVWMLAIASFFVYMLRMGVSDWSASYLIETKHYSMVKASTCVGMFEVGGLFGMIAAGWLSDKIHQGRRGPMNVLFSLGMLISVGFFWFLPQVGMFLDSALLFSIGFFLFGPQMLIGLAAAELSHKKAAGTASGFAGWGAGIGGAAAGYPLGKIMEHYSWDGYFFALIACSFITILLFLPMWNARSYETKKPVMEPESEVGPEMAQE